MTPLLLFLLGLQEPPAVSWETVRDQVVPPAEELAWREIPWRATFWEAVVEAQKKDMPVLLWAMNGHPLACT